MQELTEEQSNAIRALWNPPPLEPCVCKTQLRLRQRQEQDIIDSVLKPDFSWFYDVSAADRAVKYFSHLKHFKGEFAGQQFKLSLWQEWEIIRPLFGWKNKATGKRRFRTCFIFVGRGNGKTTLAGALGGYGLLCDGEKGSEVYFTATTKAQANISYQSCKQMLLRSPFRDYVEITKDIIEKKDSPSFAMLLSGDTTNKDGTSPHFGLVDELHQHNSYEMIDVLRFGMQKREQPLLIITTTAGVDDVTNPARVELDYAKKLASGEIIDDTYFAYVAESELEANCLSEQLFNRSEWKKANPELGISQSYDVFQNDLNEAIEKNKLSHFKKKRLNMWSGNRENWISGEDWKRCFEPHFIRLKGCRAKIGVDLSVRGDLSAVVTVISATDYYWVYPMFFLPQTSIEEHTLRYKQPYVEWCNQGYLRQCGINYINVELIANHIRELCSTLQVTEIVIDVALSQQLLPLIESLTIVSDHKQGSMAMNHSASSLERCIITGKIKHNDNPILNHQITRATIQHDMNDNIKLVKNKQTSKIDGVVALCMAVGRWESENANAISGSIISI